MKTIDEILSYALLPVPGQHAGQSLMNRLYHVEPRAYDIVAGTDLDPFYDDRKLWAAVQHIKEHWSY